MQHYITLYTDGSCINNGKRNSLGGCGIYIDTNASFIKKNQISFKFSSICVNEKATNQKTELLAIAIALKLVKKVTNKYPNLNVKFTIITDSLYSLKCTTEWIKKWEANGWITSNKNPVKNQTLLKAIHKLSKDLPMVTFKHVRSHRKKPNNVSEESEVYKKWYGNHMADKLARNAASA